MQPNNNTLNNPEKMDLSVVKAYGRNPELADDYSNLFKEHPDLVGYIYPFVNRELTHTFDPIVRQSRRIKDESGRYTTEYETYLHSLTDSLHAIPKLIRNHPEFKEQFKQGMSSPDIAIFQHAKDYLEEMTPNLRFNPDTHHQLLARDVLPGLKVKMAADYPEGRHVYIRNKNNGSILDIGRIIKKYPNNTIDLRLMHYPELPQSLQQEYKNIPYYSNSPSLLGGIGLESRRAHVLGFNDFFHFRPFGHSMPEVAKNMSPEDIFQKWSNDHGESVERKLSDFIHHNGHDIETTIYSSQDAPRIMNIVDPHTWLVEHEIYPKWLEHLTKSPETGHYINLNRIIQKVANQYFPKGRNTSELLKEFY